MTLEQLGFDDAFATAFRTIRPQLRLDNPAALVPARVAREDRGSYVIYTANRALRASVSGAMRYAAGARCAFPSVGDWVIASARSEEQAATIHALLPRRSSVTRKSAGTRGDAQVLAANIDLLLICCGLDHDFNARRIERYVTLAYAGGASPVILLTKADLSPEADAMRAELEMTCVGVPCHTVSVIDDRGVDDVRHMLPTGVSAALVGSSGVGKSTLTNRLLGEQRLATAAVREDDSRGRHTTTFRQLLLIPGGGVIIDTPGMRELQAWADEGDIADAFSEIESLGRNCRFRDCTHISEPGCAIHAAVERGDLDPRRVENYHKQIRELQYHDRKEDRAAYLAEKNKWKVIHKAAQKHMKQKYGTS